ncbi:unnamed protein product [Rotaria magnacalcarata]|uniref:Uncharacterized protein n=1 Tax=Rotaria magnacalcarata TaxID=392030 RepID=A0A816BQK9_9BILA|nr:unnamed protein product [Rotaria magnacalcarata]CAF1611394.1 unnamed protein product [Rotaria magnacalcarata]CAF1934153.1 unnamed protein product [Rotaria magnacalcarata]CAF1938135.1 unnamed protein product [Rotaria magnacalcarata]CAF2127197.1 unnamed protein product [Rotaria magnacalcarata]
MMSFSTPIRAVESSAKRLLKRVDMCTELSFEQTPVRHAITKRKTIRKLTPTVSPDITLLDNEDQVLSSDLTIIDDSFLSIDRTPQRNNTKKNNVNSTTSISSWEVIDSIINNDTTDFSVVSINQSDFDVSQAVVITKRSMKVSIRLSSLLARIMPSSTLKTPTTSIKYVNRYVRDIDRTNDGFGREWLTLPNFV